MEALRGYFREVWAIDFEYTQPEGSRPTPLCLVGRELLSGHLVRCWLNGSTLASPPFSTDAQTLIVAYYASAEMSCFLALGWPFPARLLDLYAEFRNVTNGLWVPCGH